MPNIKGYTISRKVNNNYYIVKECRGLKEVAEYGRKNNVRGLSLRNLRYKFEGFERINIGNIYIREHDIEGPSPPTDKDDLTGYKISPKLRNAKKTTTGTEINNRLVELEFRYKIKDLVIRSRGKSFDLLKFCEDEIHKKGRDTNMRNLYQIILKSKARIIEEPEEVEGFGRGFIFAEEYEKEVEVISTKIMNVNLVLNDLNKKLIRYFQTYEAPELGVSQIIIKQKKLPRINRRIVFGFTGNATDLYENFINSMFNGEYKRKTMIKKYTDLMNEYNIISPSSYKNCFIKACLMSYYKKDDDDEIKRKAKNMIEKHKLSKRDRIIEHMSEIMSKELKTNIHVIDGYDFDNYKTNEYDSEIKIIIYGSHAYALIKKEDSKNYNNKIKIRKNGEILIKSKEHKKDFSDFEIATYDLETCDGEKIDDNKNEAHTYMGGFTNGKKYTEFSMDDEKTNILKDFLSFLSSNQNKDNKLIIYGHNAGKFDNWILIKEIINARNFNILNAVIKDGRIISLDLLCKSNGKRFIFRDSYCLIASSLDTACKSFDTKIKKLTGDVDHDKINITNCHTVETYEYVRKYLEHDVKSLYNIITDFRKIILENLKIDIKNILTSASIAREYWLTTHDHEKYPIYTVDQEIDNEIRPHYFGGRNECLTRLGHIQGKIYYYDFTSLFPSIMFKYNFGYDKLTVRNINKFDPKSFGMYKVLFRHKKCDKLPLHPVLHEDKLTFPYVKEWREGVFSSESIQYSINNNLGYEYKFLKIYEYEKYGRYFMDLINKLFELKKEAKKKGQISLCNSIKIIINSIYGFWGINLYNKEKVQIKQYKNDVKKKCDLINYMCTGKLIDYNTINNYTFYKYEDDLKMKIHNIIIASMVTDYARLELYDLMRRVQEKGGEIYYCDTDSIFTNYCIEDDEELRELYMKNGGTELGELKNETDIYKGYYTDLLNIGCKQYYAKNREPNSKVEDVEKFKGFCVKKDGKLIKFNKKIYDDSDPKNKKIILKGKNQITGTEYITFDDYIKLIDGWKIEGDNMSFMGNSNILMNNTKLYKINNIKQVQMLYTKGNLDKDMNISPLVI